MKLDKSCDLNPYISFVFASTLKTPSRNSTNKEYVSHEKKVSKMLREL